MSTRQLHLVLLGDSIFDNKAYVPDGPAVVDHLRRLLPAPWRVTLLAHDGDITSDVERQLVRMPSDATHLVISVGGNDALGAMGVLSFPAGTVNNALSHLAELRADFYSGYRTMLWQALCLQLPLAVCTIYDAVPDLDVESKTALALFNDTITRTAFGVNVPVIDLRHVCTEAGDYSALSPIEPSAQGGEKIANAIVHCLMAGVI